MVAMTSMRYMLSALAIICLFGCVTQTQQLDVLEYSVANWTTAKIIRGMIAFGTDRSEPFGVLSPNVAKAYSFYGVSESQQHVSLDWIVEGGLSNHCAFSAGELPPGAGRLLFRITGTNRACVVRAPKH
jgi:hypothetical protein